jgi:hypothetical protein
MDNDNVHLPGTTLVSPTRALHLHEQAAPCYPTNSASRKSMMRVLVLSVCWSV